MTAPFVSTLDRYGREGRFYYLDDLAAATQAKPPPFHFWTDTENTTHQDPAVRKLFDTAMKTPEDDAVWQKYHTTVRERVATTAENICAAISMAGIQRLYGEPGRIFGTEINLDMVGRQTD